MTAFTFKGYWHQDVIDKGFWFWFLERSLDKILNRVIVPILRGKNNIEPISIHLLRNEITYVPYADKQLFYEKTREYTRKLFDLANVNKKEYVMVDQLVPPSNTQKYLKYFDDLRIVSVDRDPRDLFILEKYLWKGGVIPIENVYDFCKWFKLTRQHIKYEKDDPQKILRIQFEDLIYHYDETLDVIMKFLGLEVSMHISPKSKFIPGQSIKNTQLWKKYPEMRNEIKVIETELADYCYKKFE